VVRYSWRDRGDNPEFHLVGRKWRDSAITSEKRAETDLFWRGSPWKNDLRKIGCAGEPAHSTSPARWKGDFSMEKGPVTAAGKKTMRSDRVVIGEGRKGSANKKTFGPNGRKKRKEIHFP